MLSERFHQCLLSLRDPDNEVVWATPVFFAFVKKIVKILMMFEDSHIDYRRLAPCRSIWIESESYLSSDSKGLLLRRFFTPEIRFYKSPSY